MQDGALIAVYRPHLLRPERTVAHVAHGRSLREILAEVAPGLDHGHVVATVDGRRVDDLGHRPEPGAILSFVAYPGDAQSLRPILMLAVVVAAAVIAPYATAGLGITTAAGYSAATVAGVTTGIAAVTSAAGMLLVNTLVPVPAALGSQGRKSSAWSLERASNAARPYSAIPRVFGRHRYTPPLAADVVPEAEGKTSSIRFAVTWGYGPVTLSDLRFGDTPIDTIEGLDQEDFPGTPGQVADLALYSDDYAVEPVDAAITVEAGPITRRCAPGADEAILQITLPRGLADMQKGSADDLKVQFQIETRPIGGAWTVWQDVTLTKKTTTPIRLVYRQVLTEDLDFRVSRITKDRGDVAKLDDIVWTALISVRHTNPFAAKGVAISAFRVPAGEKASGNLQALNALVTALIRDYDTGSGTWVVRETSNPASIALEVLQGSANGRPVEDDRIDWDAFAAWHGYCATKGLTCNLVVDWDGATVEDVLKIVAACGDAIIRPVGGRLAPVIDQPQPIPVQLVTPRNSWGFAATRLLPERPHGLRVRFLDEEADYAPDERVVYADGYDEGNATRIDDFELPGVTSAALVYRHARRRLAEIWFRREKYQFQMDWEHLVCRMGDRIEIAHDVLAVAVGWGRVRSVARDGANNATALALDEEITLTAGVPYVLTVRSATTGIALHALAPVTETGPTSLFTLATPTADVAEVDDLVVVGEQGIETLPALVTMVRPSGDLSAMIEAVPYDEGIYSADSEPIPAWNPRVNVSAIATPPVIRSAWRTLASRDVLVALDPALVEISALEIGWNDDLSATDWFTSSWPPDTVMARLGAVGTEGTVYVRARWRLPNGRASVWSAPVLVQLTAYGEAPNVTAAWTDGNELVWLAPAPSGIAGYRIRWVVSGGDWSMAVPAHDGLVVGTRWSARQLPVAHCDLLIVAVTLAGSESPTPFRVPYARVDETGGWHALVRDSEAAKGFPGALTGGQRGAFGLAGASSPYLWPDPTAPAWPDPEAFAFPTYVEGTWSYHTEWVVPETVELLGEAIPVTAADMVGIAVDLIAGTLNSVDYAITAAGMEEVPFADERLFADGRGFVREGDLPWLPWPRIIRADPGRKLRVRIACTGVVRDVVLILYRQLKFSLVSDVVIPLAGTTVGSEKEVVALVNVQATTKSPGIVISATTNGRTAELKAFDLTGAPAVAVADVLIGGV